MRSTFKVLFYLKKNAPKKDGSVPVMCRITIDGTIAQFSCKCDILPNLWDVKSNRASGKSAVALETNRFLDKIRVVSMPNTRRLPKGTTMSQRRK